ncbi:TetR/AcrR family transcriptional regulator [Spirillospora sp. NPDC047279]|uniref:TetR/AcrR family transcriptional regulator n=1 Tax=Spirillospora sp. NPDC047279 TaxID=3155478 RepID=UPI0033FE63CA
MADSVKGPKKDGRAARWEEHRGRRRAEFVDAAVRAVERHGPDVRTDQIAAEAGVPRPRLYRYFDGKADLERAIVERAGDLCAAEFAALWDPHGTPAQIIGTAADSWLRWVTDHANLYRYARKVHAAGLHAPYSETKSAFGGRVSALLRAYAGFLGLDPRVAEPLSSGILGMAEAATHRWLEAGQEVGRDEMAGHLARWIIAMLTDTAAHLGTSLDPSKPLPELATVRPAAD